MIVRVTRWSNLISAGITLGALFAHVLELPNKFSLDGPLWLAVQQHLYWGWGPFIGAFEVIAIGSAIFLAYLLRHEFTFRRTAMAAALMLAALAVFFLLNAPVNQAFAGWTAATLPPDWPDYRLRWEAGHAISFVLFLAAIISMVNAWLEDKLVAAFQEGKAKPNTSAMRPSMVHS